MARQDRLEMTRRIPFDRDGAGTVELWQTPDTDAGWSHHDRRVCQRLSEVMSARWERTLPMLQVSMASDSCVNGMES